MAVVDADDVWLPHKLERQLAVFAANPAIHALHGSAVFVDDLLRPLFVAPSPDGKNELLDVLCFRGLAAMMVTLIIDRALLARLGGFDPSLVILQDWELGIRLARLGELYSTSEPLVLYRLHASNQSKQIDLHIEPGSGCSADYLPTPRYPLRSRCAGRTCMRISTRCSPAAPSRSVAPPTLFTGRAGRSRPIRESCISPHYPRAG